MWKDLWEQMSQLLLCKCVCIFHSWKWEWELFYWYQIAAGALQVQFWLAHCVLQSAVEIWWKPNWLLIYCFSSAWKKVSRNYILVLPVFVLTKRCNTGAKFSVLCPVAYMDLPCQCTIWGHSGKRSKWVLYSICCQSLFYFFFLRLLGASYPGPVGSGSCDPPSTFFNDDDMKSVDIFYSGC